MGKIRYTYRIDAPPEDAFELGLKVERFPEWFTSLIEVRNITGPLDRVGSAYTAIMRIAGRPLEVHWEVTKVEKPLYLELKGTSPAGGFARYVVKNEPIGKATEVFIELEYELPGSFLGQFMDRLFVERAIERDVKHSAENFKAIVEAAVPALA